MTSLIHLPVGSCNSRLSVELVPGDRDCRLLLLGKFVSCGVFVEVEVGADGEP